MKVDFGFLRFDLLFCCYPSKDLILIYVDLLKIFRHNLDYLKRNSFSFLHGCLIEIEISTTGILLIQVYINYALIVIVKGFWTLGFLVR